MAEPTIQVQIDEDFQALVDPAWVVSIVKKTLELEKVAATAEVSVLITGQDMIQQLNRDYRNLDEPTDVLSFALTETRDRRRKFRIPPDGILRLGDIIVSYPQAAKQAAEDGSATTQEVALLLVHGVLHLLGYDHAKTEEKTIMKGKELSVLARLYANSDYVATEADCG
jgi:probable rRNA maturation factor